MMIKKTYYNVIKKNYNHASKTTFVKYSMSVFSCFYAVYPCANKVFKRTKKHSFLNLPSVKSTDRNQEQSNTHQAFTQHRHEKNEIYKNKRKWKSKLPNKDFETA